MEAANIDAPIFIIGMPRSGTTILSEAISLHQDLGWFSNYLEHVPFFPWIALLSRITSISRAGSHLRGRKRQKDGLPSFVRWFLPYSDEAFSVWARCCGERFLWDYLIGEAGSKREISCMTKYIQRVLQWQGKSRFFTKFTGPARVHYLSSIFPDAFFVHVIRDPRAVVSSLLKVSFWKNGHGLSRPWWRNGLTDHDIQEWEESRRSPIALSAVQWRRVVELTWDEKASIAPERYLEIRYEDFVEEPHRMLSIAFQKVGLDDSSVAHRYLSSVGKLYNMNYKYQRHLRPGEISLVERITSETAKRAGYEF